MKKLTLLFLTICFYTVANSQQTEKEEANSQALLKELAENACNCVDYIKVYNKSKNVISTEVSKCIEAQASAYQIGAELMNNMTLEKDAKKQNNIEININKNTENYKAYYYEMERYVMSNCSIAKEKLAAENKESEKSFSDNPKAVDFYNKGTEEFEQENYKKAVDYFKKALKVDDKFAFAWDNLGLCYRKLGEYDKALDAYNKSLEIDPDGLLPLQNIAVVYQYKKEYENAIETYKKIAVIDNKNPEVYYGIGLIYTANLKNYEEGLDNMCKAYNLYVAQKSPYRTDAEKIINTIYKDMKEQGKEDKFKEILKSNNINIK